MQNILILEVLGDTVRSDVHQCRCETEPDVKYDYKTPLEAIKEGWSLLGVPTCQNMQIKYRMVYEWWLVRE